MPVTRTSFVRTSAILLLVGLVALLGIIGSIIWLVERTQVYFDEVIEARDARAATVDLRNALLRAESSQRGYLITLENRYLEPYQNHILEIMPGFERFNDLLAPYPQAVEPLDRLRAGLAEKIAEMEETIRLARAGNRDAAFAIVAGDQGQEIMEEAQTFFSAVLRAADERLTEGVADQRDAAAQLRWTSIIGGLVIVLVVSGSVAMAVAYTRDLVVARAEVESLNAGLEERIRERTHELVRANEEVQRFAYIVTHDLRAPLVNIMGFTSELDTTMKSIQAYVLADGEALDAQEIQEARTAASEDLPEAIGFIRSSTRKMDSLINAILKISRDGRRPLKPERIDLRELLEANLATIQHQVVDSDGETILDVDAPAIISDRMALEQAVGNLLDNAVKYRAPDRPIEIRVEARRAPGNRIRIDVADNGRGIAPEDHERVFDLFRRSGQQDQPGEGIGLAHVRTLVRGLGGDITIESEFGKGSTFTIYLPVDVRTATRSFEA